MNGPEAIHHYTNWLEVSGVKVKLLCGPGLIPALPLARHQSHSKLCIYHVSHTHSEQSHPETDEGLKIAAAQRWTLVVTDISISEEECTIFEMAVLWKKPISWNYGDIS